MLGFFCGVNKKSKKVNKIALENICQSFILPLLLLNILKNIIRAVKSFCDFTALFDAIKAL